MGVYCMLFLFFVFFVCCLCVFLFLQLCVIVVVYNWFVFCLFLWIWLLGGVEVDYEVVLKQDNNGYIFKCFLKISYLVLYDFLIFFELQYEMLFKLDCEIVYLLGLFVLDSYEVESCIYLVVREVQVCVQKWVCEVIFMIFQIIF